MIAQAAPLAPKTITVEHSPDHGTKVEIEDPSWTEILALALILAAVVAMFAFWRRFGRRR